MRFFSSNDFAAIDLGTHTVKLMILSERKNRWRVEKLHSIQTGITSQTPQDQVLPRQGAALTALMKSAGVRAKATVGCIPGRSAFFRGLRIPSVGGERLDRIVRYEARQQIPFALDQVIYDFHQSRSEDMDVDVTLLAAKKDLINEYVETVRNAGLALEYLDVSTVALFNSFVAGHPSIANDVVAIVDIGATTTDIVISSEGTLRFMRSATVAGNRLTQLVAQIFAIPIEEAEQLKVRTFTPREEGEGLPVNLLQPGDNRVVDAVNRGMEEIVTEVRRSLDFFISRPEGVPVNSVMLVGGTSRINGICEFFEERLGLDVFTEPGFTIDGIDTGRLAADDLPLAGIGLGLGLKAARRAPVDMNFTPVTIRQTQAIRERRPSFIVEGVLVATVIALLTANVMIELDLSSKVLANVSSVVDLTGAQVGELRAAIAQEAELRNRLDTLRDIAGRRGFITTVLGDLSRLKPAGVWVESTTMTTNNMGVIGRSEQEKYVRDFITSLSVSPYFSEVRIREMKRDQGTVLYRIQISQLLHPDADVVDFIDRVRRNMSAFQQQRRVVEVRTAAVDKQARTAQVYYTHVDVSAQMLEDLHRASVAALVESRPEGEQRPSVDTLEIVAFGMRGDALPLLSKSVSFDVGAKLYRGEITYDEFLAEMKDISGEIARRFAQGS